MSESGPIKFLGPAGESGTASAGPVGKEVPE